MVSSFVLTNADSFTPCFRANNFLYDDYNIADGS